MIKKICQLYLSQIYSSLFVTVVNVKINVRMTPTLQNEREARIIMRWLRCDTNFSLFSFLFFRQNKHIKIQWVINEK